MVQGLALLDKVNKDSLTEKVTFELLSHLFPNSQILVRMNAIQCGSRKLPDGR